MLHLVFSRIYFKGTSQKRLDNWGSMIQAADCTILASLAALQAAGSNMMGIFLFSQTPELVHAEDRQSGDSKNRFIDCTGSYAHFVMVPFQSHSRTKPPPEDDKRNLLEVEFQRPTHIVRYLPRRCQGRVMHTSKSHATNPKHPQAWSHPGPGCHVQDLHLPVVGARNQGCRVRAIGLQISGSFFGVGCEFRTC